MYWYTWQNINGSVECCLSCLNFREWSWVSPYGMLMARDFDEVFSQGMQSIYSLCQTTRAPMLQQHWEREEHGFICKVTTFSYYNLGLDFVNVPGAKFMNVTGILMVVIGDQYKCMFVKRLQLFSMIVQEWYKLLNLKLP